MDIPWNDIWVLIEATTAEAARVGFELLTPGRQLASASAQTLTAVAIGPLAAQASEQATARGADHAFAVSGPSFSIYRTETFVAALSQLIAAHQPSVLLIGATENGRDLAPRIACRFQTGLTADCTAIGMDPNRNIVKWTRPALSGNLMATIICADRRPQMGTVRPGVFAPPPADFGKKGIIRREEIRIDPVSLCVRRILHRKTEGNDAAFDSCDIIVSGGLGLNSKENFNLIHQLAAALHGAVGASRAAVNAGWIPYTHQIGQSGKTVRPKVYIACGISGAVQHLAGISGADTVIAINHDRNAPIFQVADYGIVGNVCDIIPAILDAIRHQARTQSKNEY